MSKPVAYCSIDGRGFAQWEVNNFKVILGGTTIVCNCHHQPIAKEYPFNIAEKLHEMIAEHNKGLEKIFYYSEDEVKQLCKDAFWLSDYHERTFETWWDNVKKK